MPDSVVYPSWEPISEQLLPARSYFYHLQPLAVGSAYVESFTSYLTRLAAAHDVTPRMLMTRELLPKVRETFRRHAYRVTECSSTAFVYSSHTLNGVGQSSSDWVSVVETLTGVRSLQALTMRPWSRVIAQRGLLRRRRSWCARCYEDWRIQGRAVYDPLLWSIAEVNVCPAHETVLEHRCPRCAGEQYFMSSRSRAGHCCRCWCWLGLKAASLNAAGEFRTETIAATHVGELLAATCDLSFAPSSDILLSNLRYCIEELAGGSISRFALAAGMSFDLMFGQFDPTRLVTLNLLRRICAPLGISPLRLLSERISPDTLDCEQIRRVIFDRTSHIAASHRIQVLRPVLEQAANAETAVSLCEIAAELGYSSAQSLRRRESVLCDRISERYRAAVGTPLKTASRGPFPPDAVIKEALTNALLAPTQPRLKAITRALGFRCDVSLYNRFPELCKAFARNNAAAREKQLDLFRGTIESAVSETPPPTLKDLARRLGWTPTALAYRFPEACRRIVAKQPEREMLVRREQRACLQLAVHEEPPPSVRSVAGRVGVCSSTLRRHHPDLYAQIRRRHDDLKLRLASTRRDIFRAEIDAALGHIHQLGIVPSRRRVFASIRNPSMRSTAILDRRIAATLVQLKVASGVSIPDGRGPNHGSLGREPSAGRAESEP